MLKISTPNLSEASIQAVGDVLRSGSLVQGKQVVEFERELADFMKLPYVALVSSGTAALHLALLSLELPANTGVIIPNFTFPATANAVLMAGLVPVIADVCLDRYVMTIDSVSEAFEYAQLQGIDVSAIMPVHEFGQPVDAQALNIFAREHNLRVVEDAACALGAHYRYRGQDVHVGAHAHLACFSFHPRKTLTTGEGGAIVTSSVHLYERVICLRNHGIKYGENGARFVSPGLNYRLTDFQAVLGREQLPHLPRWIEERRELAKRYNELLCFEGIHSPPLTPGHSWQTFMVRLASRYDRDLVIKTLRSQGIECNIGAQVLSEIDHLKPYSSSQTMKSRELHRSSLALPLCEKYTLGEVEYVVSTLKSILQSDASLR